MTKKNKINTKKVGVFMESDPITNAYYNEIRNTPLLSQEEEVELFKAYKERGCLYAKNKIIKSNLRFVVSVAKKYAKNPSILVDLINEGNIGLIKAIDKFDVNRGNKFITFAVDWIQRGIRAFLMENNLIRKTNLQKTVFHVDKIKERFRKENGVEISNSELMEKLDNLYDIKIIEESDLYDLDINSIDSPLNTQTDNNEFSPTEREMNDMFQVENEVNQILNQEDNIVSLKEYMTILLPREKKIVELFFGINSNSEHTFDDIAKMFSYTPERIRQIISCTKKIMLIRSKVNKIDNITKYLTPLSKLEVFLLDLHLRKRYTPSQISKKTVFTPESIQQSLCESINMVYDFYNYKLNNNDDFN